jgi:hypothetical protein
MPVNIKQGAQALIQPVNDANLVAITSGLNEALDSGYFWPGAEIPAGTSQEAPSFGLAAGFPAGSNTSCGWGLRPKTSWNNHRMVAHLIYTSPSAGGGTYGVLVTLREWASPGNLGSPSVVGVVTQALAPPTNAFDILTADYTMATGAITSSMELLTLFIARNGATDGQAGKLLLLGVGWTVYAN